MRGQQFEDEHGCQCRTGLSGEGEIICQHVKPGEPCSVSAESVLELENVSKQYGDETAVSDLSFSVREGELLTILGPSGCGKTTALRLIAGLERPTEGTVTVRDESVAGDGFVKPEQRDVGLVFQEFALFPHMSVRENIAFGIDDWDADERRERVDTLLSLVDLEAKGDEYPENLSGGQRQRVALARSLAPEPDVVLLDEPFSNLDVDLRVRMREEVRDILKSAGVTAISVTHDQEEGLSISDRVAVMRNGSIEQIGHPEEVFQRPKSRFVAEFLGNASFLSSTVGAEFVETPLASISRENFHGLDRAYDDASIDVLVRPDDLLATASPNESNGYVTYRRYLGPSILYRIELDNGDVVECLHNHSERLELGMRVQVQLHADHELAWFPHNGNRRTSEPPAADASEPLSEPRIATKAHLDD